MDLTGKVENLQGRATPELIASDDTPPRPTYLVCHAGRSIPTSARLTAYDLLNAANRTVAERKLYALVDAVACLLAHDGPHASQETARLALESVVGSAVALAAVRTLLTAATPT